MSLATIYQHHHLGGAGRTFVIERPTLLRKVTQAELEGTPYFVWFESADVHGWSAGNVTRLIAFSFGFEGSWIHLVGDAQGSTVGANTKTPWGLPVSALLIGIQPDQEEVALSVRTLFLSEWNRLVDANLEPGCSRYGAPLFTARLFPEREGPTFSPAGMYLRIRQIIWISDGIRHGQATITIDLRPYMGDGVVRVEPVQQYGSYFLAPSKPSTGGYWDYSMAETIPGYSPWIPTYDDPLIPPWFEPMVERLTKQTVDRLDARLRTALGAPADRVIPPDKPVRGLYVLPGIHVPLPTSAAPLSGTDSMDTTIVAIR